MIIADGELGDGADENIKATLRGGLSEVWRPFSIFRNF